METPVLKKELDRSVSFWKARSEQTLPPMRVQAQRSGKQEGLLWGQAPRGHPGLRPAGSLMGTQGSVQLGAMWHGEPGISPAAG